MSNEEILDEWMARWKSGISLSNIALVDLQNILKRAAELNLADTIVPPSAHHYEYHAGYKAGRESALSFLNDPNNADIAALIREREEIAEWEGK